MGHLLMLLLLSLLLLLLQELLMRVEPVLAKQLLLMRRMLLRRLLLNRMRRPYISIDVSIHACWRNCAVHLYPLGTLFCWSLVQQSLDNIVLHFTDLQRSTNSPDTQSLN